jgi:hypothetical protein
LWGVYLQSGQRGSKRYSVTTVAILLAIMINIS